MKLRSKLSLYILGLFIVLQGFNFYILTNQIWPMLNLYEVFVAKNIMDRAMIKLEDESERLVRIASRWASQKDVHLLMKTKDKELVSQFLQIRNFKDNNINFIFLFSPDGRIIAGKGFDLIDGKEIILPHVRAGKLSNKLNVLIDQSDPNAT